MKLIHLQTGSPGTGTYSIWKATTYVEPAEWLYDVVVADGSVIRPGHRELPGPQPASECKGPVAVRCWGDAPHPAGSANRCTSLRLPVGSQRITHA